MEWRQKSKCRFTHQCSRDLKVLVSFSLCFFFDFFFDYGVATEPGIYTKGCNWGPGLTLSLQVGAELCHLKKNWTASLNFHHRTCYPWKNNGRMGGAAAIICAPTAYVGFQVGWRLRDFDLTVGWPDNWPVWMVYQSIDQSNPLSTNIFCIARRVIFGGIDWCLNRPHATLNSLRQP